MSQEEQQQQYGKLAMERKTLRREIACLASKGREAATLAFGILKAVESPYGSDWDDLKRKVDAEDMDLKIFVDEMRTLTQRLGTVQTELDAIDGS